MTTRDKAIEKAAHEVMEPNSGTMARVRLAAALALPPDAPQITESLKEWALKLLRTEDFVRHSHDFDAFSNEGGSPRDRALEIALAHIGPPPVD